MGGEISRELSQAHARGKRNKRRTARKKSSMSSLNTITADDPDAKPTTRSRIVRYDEYFDLRTFSKTLRKTAKPSKKLNSKKPVIIVRRKIDDKGRHYSTQVDIKSPALSQVLLDINSDVEGLTFSLHNLTMDSSELFHSRTGLLDRLEEENVKPEPDPALIADISTALQYIDEDFAETFGSFDLLSRTEISYDHLWAIFPPNTLVYRAQSHTEQTQILLARTFEYTRTENHSPCARIECDIVTHDGNSFGLARITIDLNQFRGNRRIQDLPFFPLAYHSDEENIYAHALARGKRFATLSAGTHSYHEISGPALGEKVSSEGKTRLHKFSTHGRVMVDPVAFRLFRPNSIFNPEVHRKLEMDNLTDEQYMICTPVVLGFCFGVKMWGGFALDRLQDVAWSDEPFRLLVLGAKQKSLIHSLFKSHTLHAATFDDIVRGKGKGLIGLFSGSPGCGKTLTAEAVAEATRRPLYSISAGDLGTDPKELDERLTLVLEIAQTWNAVLLLDEAEVFLQQRTKGEVARNALVSIFLRQLEYYKGILILTTNLIEQCDPAFESRIHFSVHYPDLEFDSRRQIWQTFLAKVLKNPDTDINPEHLDRLAQLQVNGRQIKNIVSSAQCVALDAGTDLAIEHIDAVLEVVEDWNVAKERSAQS